jgi:hypothetical protein
MGVAAKVVPTLTGRDPRALSSLWGPFLLVNIGCFLRVSTQTLTDWSSFFYSIIGLSGTLEVTGLAWWGAHLARMMLSSSHPSVEAADESAGQRIMADHLVADVLRRHPQALSIFERFGFTMLRNAAAQRMIASRVTIRQAAAFRGVALEPLLRSLNQTDQSQGALRYDATLEELVERLPAAATVLERYGLNPQCHGRLTLAQACEQVNVPKESLVCELAQAAASGMDACSDPCGRECGGCGHPAESGTCHGARQGASGREVR